MVGRQLSAALMCAKLFISAFPYEQPLADNETAGQHFRNAKTAFLNAHDGFFNEGSQKGWSHWYYRAAQTWDLHKSNPAPTFL
jgi:hypothetical protein